MQIPVEIWQVNNSEWRVRIYYVVYSFASEKEAIDFAQTVEPDYAPVSD